MEAAGERQYRVVFFEGVHGVGKTTILTELQSQGYYVIPEGFDMDDGTLDDYLSEQEQGHNFACELEWVGRMFKRIYEAIVKARLGQIVLRDDYIFVDRSYITAMVYGKIDDPAAATAYIQLCKLIASQLEALNVKLLVLYLERDDVHLQFRKIQERLKLEPARARLKEGSKEWLYTCLERYGELMKDVPMLKYTLKDAYNGDVKQSVSYLMSFINLTFTLIKWSEHK